MNNSVLLKDAIASIRIGLNDRIYTDEDFFKQFIQHISGHIVIVDYTHDQLRRTISITINKNLCGEIPEFSHKKEFYASIINDAYVQALNDMITLYARRRDKVESTNFINDILAKCANRNIDSFLLFDVTPILDNVILIHL